MPNRVTWALIKSNLVVMRVNGKIMCKTDGERCYGRLACYMRDNGWMERCKARGESFIRLVIIIQEDSSWIKSMVGESMF